MRRDTPARAGSSTWRVRGRPRSPSFSASAVDSSCGTTRSCFSENDRSSDASPFCLSSCGRSTRSTIAASTLSPPSSSCRAIERLARRRSCSSRSAWARTTDTSHVPPPKSKTRIVRGCDRSKKRPSSDPRPAGEQPVEEGRVRLVEKALLRERQAGEAGGPERVLARRQQEGRRHRHHGPSQGLRAHLGLDRLAQLREDAAGHLPGRVVLARGGEGIERLPPQPHLGLRGVEHLPPAQEAAAAGLASAPPHPPLPRPDLGHHGGEERARHRPVLRLLPDRQHLHGAVGVAVEQRERVHDRHRRARRPEVDPHVVPGLLESVLDLPARAARQGRRERRRAARGCRGHRLKRQERVS